MFRIPDYGPRLARLRKIRDTVAAHIRWCFQWHNRWGRAGYWEGLMIGPNHYPGEWNMTKDASDHIFRWQQRLKEIDEELDRIVTINRHYGVHIEAR